VCDTTPPTISLKRLYIPRCTGGLEILNISARNKTIGLTWLKTYSDLSPTCPTWAFVTDAILNHICPDHTFTSKKPHFALTSWFPPTRGKRAKTLPPCVLNLIKSAWASTLTFAPLKLSKRLKQQLPAWLHLSATPRTYNKTKDKCLQSIHRAQRTKDLIKSCKCLSPPNPQHHPRRNCTCTPCHDNREKGCKNPHKCAENAKKILDGLAPLLTPPRNPQKTGSP